MIYCSQLCSSFILFMTNTPQAGLDGLEVLGYDTSGLSNLVTTRKRTFIAGISRLRLALGWPWLAATSSGLAFAKNLTAVQADGLHIFSPILHLRHTRISLLDLQIEAKLK